MTKKTILSLIILILTSFPLLTADKPLSEHELYSREREKEAHYKSMQEKGIRFGAGFGPSPFIKWFNVVS